MPSHVPRRTARSYDKGSRISRHLCRCTQRTTMCPVRVIQRAAPRVTPTRSSTTSWIGRTTPQSSLRLARTSPPQRCFCAAFPSRATPRNRRSTGTSEHWWRPPPFNRRRAPHCGTDSRPLSSPGEWGRTRRIAPPAHCYIQQAWHRKPLLHLVLTWRPLRTDHLYTSGSGRTETHTVATRVLARMGWDHGLLSNASNERHSRSAPMETEAKARPSARIKMRAPPCRRGKE